MRYTLTIAIVAILSALILSSCANTIRGKLVGDTHEGADEDINMLAKKYIDADEYPFRQPGEVRVKFTLEPEKVNYLKQG